MTPFDHPSLSLRVTDVERARAEAVLKEAYVDGRIDMVEFDRRVGHVMQARSRSDLNACLTGLPRPPQPLVPFGAGGLATPRKATGAAAAAHFLPFVTWVFGPLAVWALSAPRSYARREAAKAFNWQFTSTILLVIAGIVGSMIGHTIVSQIIGLAWVGWLVLTVVGGVKAAQGLDWKNPVNRVVRWNVLDPSGR